MSDRYLEIPVIKKLRIQFIDYTEYVKIGQRSKGFSWMVSVFDGSIQVKAFLAKSKKKAKKKALRWVYENYNAPLNLEESDLLYHQPEDV